MKRSLRVGTRGSTLALTQARWVQTRLRERHPELDVELVTIKTSGDRFGDRPLSTIGGKGLFVKEIEEALCAGTIDAAVHSMKDVPNELAPGLVIAAVPAREDPRDVLLTPYGTLAALPAHARVGTSSLRRMALLRAARRDLDVQTLRGNVETRLRKLDQGEVDAVVLAAAGLRRLRIARADMICFAPEDFLPAIGQGALAIETRNDDTALLFVDLEDEDTRVRVTAERAFLKRVGGSCRTPLAAHAIVTADTVSLQALIAAVDGGRIIRGDRSGPRPQAATLGTVLADDLLARGGREILAALEAPSAE